MQKKDIKKLATLARLEMSDQELEQFTREIDSIMSHIDTINELSLDSVEPLTHVSQHLMAYGKEAKDGDETSFVNIFREDVASDSFGTDRALENAPLVSGKFFQVPLIKD